jgi:hypothetical protein
VELAELVYLLPEGVDLGRQMCDVAAGGRFGFGFALADPVEQPRGQAGGDDAQSAPGNPKITRALIDETQLRSRTTGLALSTAIASSTTCSCRSG